MKYLSSLLPLVFLAACNQSADRTTDESQYEPYPTIKIDTLSSATEGIIESSATTTEDTYETDETNKWQYNVPMSGNNFRNTRSASLKANDEDAYLKLKKGKDFNMAILLTDERFYEDESQQMDITVTFDEEEAEEYTCSIDPDFGFLIIDQRKDFVQKLKKSETVTIETVSKEIVQRKEITYPNSKKNSSFGFRKKRRSLFSSPGAPVEKTITETQLNHQIWEFNSAGLKWKYQKEKRSSVETADL